MLFLRSFATFAMTSILAGALVACSGTPQPPALRATTPNQQSIARLESNTYGGSYTRNVEEQSGILDSKSTSSLYVIGLEASSLDEFALPNKKNLPPRCMDTFSESEFDGIGVDAKHTLYVPDYKKDVIYTFGPNCGKQGPTLTDPNGGPNDIAFNNKKGIIYVADLSTNCVDVYAKGATAPTGTLCNSATSTNYGLGIDSKGNVYQSGFGSNNIVEFPLGKQNGSKILSITGLDGPGGIIFDKTDNMIVFNYDAGNILVYAPPYNGGPTNTFVTQNAYYGKLDATNTNLYVGNFNHGLVNVYSYPSGKYEYHITNGLSAAQGIAVDPPSP